MTKRLTVFDTIGGLEAMQVVHQCFYDKVYVHPWLKLFFVGHAQQAIERRQTSFMAEKMGGPVEYMGKQPQMAHRQMYITEELFALRQSLLSTALVETGIEESLRQRWLRIDAAFKNTVVKPSIKVFYQQTWKYEKRIIIPRPRNCNDV